MKHFLLGLRIRVKLLAAFGSILLLSVLLIIFSISSINRIIHYKAINEDVDRLKLNMETLDLACKKVLYEEFKTKSFFENGSCPAITSFDSSYHVVRQVVDRIHTYSLIEDDATLQLTGSMTTTLDSLRKDFSLLIKLLDKEVSVTMDWKVLFVRLFMP